MPIGYINPECTRIVKIVVVFVVNGHTCCGRVVSEMCKNPMWAAVTFVDRFNGQLGISVCVKRSREGLAKCFHYKMKIRKTNMCTNCVFSEQIK